MKFLKDPESQVVTRRLAKDVIARFNDQIDEYNTIQARLKADGSDYAIEQLNTARQMVADGIERFRKAVSEGVQVSAVSPQVVEDVEALDNVITKITEFVRKIDEGEFDESELAEYGE